MRLFYEYFDLNFIIIKIMNTKNCLHSNVIILCTPVPTSRAIPFEFISANGTIDIIIYRNRSSRKKC